MDNANLQKIRTLLERARLAMQTVAATGNPLPPGFADKIVEVCVHTARNSAAKDDCEGAESIVDDALTLFPDHPDLNFERGSLLLKRRKAMEALEPLRQVLAQRPDRANTHNLISYCLQLLWRLDEAVFHLERAIELNPGSDRFRKNLAGTLSAAGRPRESAAIWRELLAKEPNNLDYLYSLAAAQNDAGELDEAKKTYRRIIDLKPESGGAHRMLGLATTYDNPDHPHIRELEEGLRRADDDLFNQREFHFALYRAHDAIGSYDRAFRHLSEANRLLGETKGYSTGSEIELIQKVRSFFSESFVQHLPASDSKDSPIFIVGLPRSGSTLAEQILASHPDVGGAGEVAVLQDIVEQELFDPMIMTLKGEIAGYGAKELNPLAERYIRALAALSPPADRITDKYLSNFIWIGVIRMLFPRARVIHCRRDPVANCFSIFSNHFETSGLLYKARLEDIGRYYNAYRGLMGHWHACFPGEIYDLTYETLTQNQEEETRKLLDYCGLSWNPACLEFHKTERTVKTTSFNQVRKAMYSGTGRKTMNYINHLQPLIRILDAAP